VLPKLEECCKERDVTALVAFRALRRSLVARRIEHRLPSLSQALALVPLLAPSPSVLLDQAVCTLGSSRPVLFGLAAALFEPSTRQNFFDAVSAPRAGPRRIASIPGLSQQ